MDNQISEDELRLLGEYICTNPAAINLSEAIREEFICANDEAEYSILIQIIIASAFILLILTAVIGNVCVMWIIFSHKVMHHGFNYFLFNMALADFLIAVLNVGSSWTFNLYYDWWYGNFCTVNQFFGLAPTSVSVLSMMALSWDRCQAVVNPLKKRPLSTRRTVITISIIWLISSLFSLPQTYFATVLTQHLFILSTRNITSRRICHTMFPEWFALQDEMPGAIYEQSLFIELYAVPLCLLSFTFARIAWAFRRSDNTVASQNSKRTDQIKAKSKAVKMLALMVAVFMICWAPYHFYHTFVGSLDNDMRRFFHSIYIGIYWLGMSSCAYNPIIYCYANARFRIGFRYAFRWLPFVDFKSEEYELSQLFPDRLRSIAASKMERSRSGKQTSSMIDPSNRKRSRLCMRLLNGGATTTYTAICTEEDIQSPQGTIPCCHRDGSEEMALEDDEEASCTSLDEESSKPLNGSAHTPKERSRRLSEFSP